MFNIPSRLKYLKENSFGGLPDILERREVVQNVV